MVLFRFSWVSSVFLIEGFFVNRQSWNEFFEQINRHYNFMYLKWSRVRFHSVAENGGKVKTFVDWVEFLSCETDIGPTLVTHQSSKHESHHGHLLELSSGSAGRMASRPGFGWRCGGIICKLRYTSLWPYVTALLTKFVHDFSLKSKLFDHSLAFIIVNIMALLRLISIVDLIQWPQMVLLLKSMVITKASGRARQALSSL